MGQRLHRRGTARCVVRNDSAILPEVECGPGRIIEQGRVGRGPVFLAVDIGGKPLRPAGQHRCQLVLHLRHQRQHRFQPGEPSGIVEPLLRQAGVIKHRRFLQIEFPLASQQFDRLSHRWRQVFPNDIKQVTLKSRVCLTQILHRMGMQGRQRGRHRAIGSGLIQGGAVIRGSGAGIPGLFAQSCLEQQGANLARGQLQLAVQRGLGGIALPQRQFGIGERHPWHLGSRSQFSRLAQQRRRTRHVACGQGLHSGSDCGAGIVAHAHSL